MTARFLLRFPLLGALLSTFLVVGPSGLLNGTAQAASCSTPIVCENQLPGTDPSVWDLSGTSNPNLQGFTTDISYNKGQPVSFKITSAAPSEVSESCEPSENNRLLSWPKKNAMPDEKSNGCS